MKHTRHLLSHRTSPRRQEGSFLLEALVAILIVAFGILGLLGLEARAIQNIDDAQYRSEAAFMTSAYIGQMWTGDQRVLDSNFDSSIAGAGTPYDEFRQWVQQRLPGASGQAPTVTVTRRPAPAVASDATITVFWKPPGETGTAYHQYTATVTIGWN